MSELDSFIVITCASGKQNAHLIPHLYSKPSIHLRLVVNSSASLSRLSSAYPKASVVQADLSERASIAPLLSDATHVYHVGPSFHPHETQIGYNIIDAAVAESKKPGSKFRHFVLSSVLCTQLRKLLNHDCKRYVEEYLMESGLNWTILQPPNFMDNIPVKMMAQQESPVYPAAWDPDIPTSMIALRDLGEAGAKVIVEGEKHYLALYPICSIRPMTYRSMMEVIAKVIGKEIRVEQVEMAEAAKQLSRRLFGNKGEQLPRASRDGVQRILLYYNEYGLPGNPNVLEWLLERKATQAEEWARSQVEE